MGLIWIDGRGERVLGDGKWWSEVCMWESNCRNYSKFIGSVSIEEVR